MAPITFGSMTISMSNVPRAIARGDNSMQFINSIVSEQPTPQGMGRGPSLTSAVARDYQGIRTNMQQEEGRGFIKTIANWIVGKKLDNAV